MTENAHAELGALFLRYRKQRINPKTGKSWTLAELSHEVSLQIQQALKLKEKEGLSASSISRFENGSLLPSRAKLKILADFLRIPDLELKPLIDLGETGTSAQYLEQKEWGWAKALESKKQKTILDRLRLISYANMAGDYQSALDSAEDALLVLDSPYNIGQEYNLLEHGVLRALIHSKKAYAQFCLEPDKSIHLDRSQEWAENAELVLQKVEPESCDPWSLTLARIETARCLTTAVQELFNFRYIQHAQYRPEEHLHAQADYLHLRGILGRFETGIQVPQVGLEHEQNQYLTELYLYLRRERDRLSFKWLEIMEAHALWQDSLLLKELDEQKPPRFEQLPAVLYWKLKAKSQSALKLLKNLYLVEKDQLVFRPAKDLQNHWQALGDTMFSTLSRHDQLDEPNPNKAYQEAVMLYPAVMVRLGKFHPLMDMSYFQLIYMQTTNQTRPTWFYIRALCFALLYRMTGELKDLECSLQNWLKYTHGDLQSLECNQELFAAMLGEAALWSTWIPLVQSSQNQKSAYVSWFVNVFEQLMNQPRYQRLKK